MWCIRRFVGPYDGHGELHQTMKCVMFAM
jgi:hypothetical protein